MHLRLLQTSAEQLYEQATIARQTGEFEVAASLLAEVEMGLGHLDGRLMWERALISRDRSQDEQAIHELNVAVELGASPGASIELAAILTNLGRWPEAVETLRGRVDDDLDPEDLLREARLAPLTSFDPFKALLADLRHSRLGPVGILRARLASIEDSAHNIETSIARVSAIVEGVAMLLESRWTGVFIFVFMLFTVAAGINQMQLLSRPWTLFVAFVLCAVVWRAAVTVVSAGARDGSDTLRWGAALALGPPLLGMLWRSSRQLWFRWRSTPPQPPKIEELKEEPQRGEQQEDFA